MTTEFKIGAKTIGKNTAPFIIAEAGINHNGEVSLAKKMIAAAKEAGADAVKFQTFRTEEFIQDKSELYTYRSQGKEVTESQYEMFKRTEFSEDAWREIKQFCEKQEITFLSTPVSVEDVRFLIELGVEAIKVGSDDFVNLPLLKKYARFRLPVILSSGMATGEEIRKSLEVVGAGKEIPICLLLCTSEYPTPAEDVNARKLLTLAEQFPEAILGLSDHTQGSTAAVVAAAYGAVVFEKHFTLDHNLPGPDHWFSADPGELKEWVEGIRTAVKMLGSEELMPTKTERTQRKVMHRSVTAITDIKAGERFTEKNLGLLRPGDGIGPMEWERIIGCKAKREIKKGQRLKWEDIKV